MIILQEITKLVEQLQKLPQPTVKTFFANRLTYGRLLTLYKDAGTLQEVATAWEPQLMGSRIDFKINEALPDHYLLDEKGKVYHWPSPTQGPGYTGPDQART